VTEPRFDGISLIAAAAIAFCLGAIVGAALVRV
jgi:hypothetical protein